MSAAEPGCVTCSRNLLLFSMSSSLAGSSRIESSTTALSENLLTVEPLQTLYLALCSFYIFIFFTFSAQKMQESSMHLCVVSCRKLLRKMSRCHRTWGTRQEKMISEEERNSGMIFLLRHRTLGRSTASGFVVFHFFQRYHLGTPTF